MSAQILRVDFARRRKWGEASTLKLFEKADDGYKVTQTLTKGWFVGRVMDRFKGELVDKLIIDLSAGLDPEKLKRASGLDVIRPEGEEEKRFRYNFASGKPESLDLDQRFVCDLRANFGDLTAYTEEPEP